jgi:hypothetical protein
MHNRYINHVTLPTGEIHRSFRNEVSDEVVSECRELLADALERPTPIPNVKPACTMKATSATEGLLVTVYGPGNVPLLTMGVSRRSKTGAELWRKR